MDQQMSTLLHLIRSIEPVTTKEYGLMIPYGQIYQAAERHSLFANTNIIDSLLVKLEKKGDLEIIYVPDCNDMISGVCLK